MVVFLRLIFFDGLRCVFDGATDYKMALEQDVGPKIFMRYPDYDIEIR
jgi:hypothetical protein